jgi:hypothetical protein
VWAIVIISLTVAGGKRRALEPVPRLVHGPAARREEFKVRIPVQGECGQAEKFLDTPGQHLVDRPKSGARASRDVRDAGLTHVEQQRQPRSVLVFRKDLVQVFSSDLPKFSTVRCWLSHFLLG